MKHKYNGHRLNNQIAFRSRLLQFVLLFTHRLNHEQTWTNKNSLDDIHARNGSRGVYWKQQTSHSPALRIPFDPQGQFPLSADALCENRHNLSSTLGIPEDKRGWVGDVAGTPSLHSLLPLFMELTAARTDLDDEWLPTKSWMHLAGQFMLQAVIEEYVRNGLSGEEPFNTIFAFGCPGKEAGVDEASDIKAMRKVFCDRETPHEQVHGWAKTKRHYINEVSGPVLFVLVRL